MKAERTAKIVVRYAEVLVPDGDTKALIALASGPLAEVGMRVIGVIIPKSKKKGTLPTTDLSPSMRFFQD